MNSFRMAAGVLVMSLACGLQAAAEDDDDDDYDDDEYGEPRRACIDVRGGTMSLRLRLQAMSDEHIYLDRMGRSYLLTARRSCRNISRGYYLTLQTDEDRRVCSTSRIEISYYDRNIAMPGCVIKTIEQVEDWDHAMAVVTQRLQEKAREEEEKKREREERKRD